MNRHSRFIAAFAIVTMGLTTGSVRAQTPSAGAQAGTAAPAPVGVSAKTDETLDTTYAKAGDKISATIQDEIVVSDKKLPKGTKLTGTIVKSVKQDKQNPHAGMILLFDTAVLKGGTTIPVHAVIISIAPSLSDSVEKVSAGSGDITDASLYAATIVDGGMADPNKGASAHTGTTVNGVRATSNVKGVLLFAPPDGSSSGVVVARAGSLQLSKWTQLNVVVTPR